MAELEVLDAGALTTVQDLGRSGWAALGVSRSGAFDRHAARLANRLVGNPDAAPLLELTLGGLVLRLHGAATVALAGAPCPGLDAGRPVSLPSGAVVALGRPDAGLRSYLAVRGGLAVAPVLGSVATDLLGGLGPAALHAGDRLALARPHPDSTPSAAAAVPHRMPPTGVPVELAVHLGPRHDWFTDAALARLRDTVWTVRPDSDRVGVRLDGPELARRRGGELASEPVLPGAVQVPPDGRPILLGPDAPVTGGYPVVAVATAAALDRAAQLRPGTGVRLVVARA